MSEEKEPAEAKEYDWDKLAEEGGELRRIWSLTMRLVWRTMT